MEKHELNPNPHLKLSDVICDRCDQSCIHDFGQGIFNVECLELSATWGYGSGHDGDKWSGVLCEKCANEMKAWIDSGPGVGILVESYLGDIDADMAANILQYKCPTWFGIDKEEYLRRLQDGEDFSSYPDHRKGEMYARLILEND